MPNMHGVNTDNIKAGDMVGTLWDRRCSKVVAIEPDGFTVESLVILNKDDIYQHWARQPSSWN